MRASSRWCLALLVTAALASLAPAPPNLPEALAAQRRLAAEQPNDAQALNDLGNLLVLAGDLEEAESSYRRAVELAPEHASMRYNLALLLQERGYSRRAAAEFQKVVRAEPGHAWAHYQLGTILAENGKRSRAVRRYADALALDPSLIEPAVNPHIVENELATEAFLLAHQRNSPASTAPRLYQQPSRVAKLLVPAEPKKEEKPAVEEQAGTERAAWRASVTPRRGAGEPEEDDPVEREEDEDEDEAGAARRSRVLTERDLAGGSAGQVMRRGSSGQRSSGSAGRVSTGFVGRTGGTTGRQPGNTTRGGQPGGVSGGGTGGGTSDPPGLPSTSRLEIDLLPSEAPMLAAFPRPSGRGT